MASSSSHATLEWYKIRDMLLQQNLVSRNIPLALELAASCHHPDARWLAEACAGKCVQTVEDAKDVFLAFGQNGDARALCFSWCLMDERERVDLFALQRSAELGFAFAQSLMAERSERGNCLRFAELAAGQGERDGFFWLGCCLCKQKELEQARESFLRACELGHVWAMFQMGKWFEQERWRWWGRAAALGYTASFLSGFARDVKLFLSGSGSAAAVYAIGQALHGHVDEDAKTIFGESFEFRRHIGSATLALAFFKQIRACRAAVDTWILVGIRWKVVKDIRKVIAKLIWDSRQEWLYKE